MNPYKTILPALFLACSIPALAQNPGPPAAPPPQPRGAGSDIGHGSGDIGKGAAKGTGKAAEGVGKGAGDVVTLHPVHGVENVGEGVGVGAKDVGVGAAKGTGDIAKGTGKLMAKPFHHHKKAPATTPQSPTPPQ